MMRRIQYYFSSIITLLMQVENWYMLPALTVRKQSSIITLRSGYKFKVRGLMDVWIVKETCLDRLYEASSIKIEDGWTVVDIGAGIGDFSILVAKENPNCRVFAFEPFPESFRLLQENLNLNRVSNVTAFQMAVGAESGKMLLAATGEAVQHTTTHNDSPVGVATTEVRGISLDEVFESNGLAYCDFLKIDCEGCEFEVLFNASSSTLERIGHICLEYHDGFTAFSHADLVDYLHQRGFRTRITTNPVHDYLGLLYAYR
nr:FkbM family methyltransferase [Ardenticatena sp.]